MSIEQLRAELNSIKQAYKTNSQSKNSIKNRIASLQKRLTYVPGYSRIVFKEPINTLAPLLSALPAGVYLDPMMERLRNSSERHITLFYGEYSLDQLEQFNALPKFISLNLRNSSLYVKEEGKRILVALKLGSEAVQQIRTVIPTDLLEDKEFHITLYKRGFKPVDSNNIIKGEPSAVLYEMINITGELDFVQHTNKK